MSWALMTNERHLLEHLVTALEIAIEAADGWCRDSRGTPVPDIDGERKLLDFAKQYLAGEQSFDGFVP